MKLNMMIAFRNLIRQKKRNIMLGIAIAFGTMILVMATSFASGITDTLFNKIIVYMTGHIRVSITEKMKYKELITRDKDRIITIITNSIEGIDYIEEEITTFSSGVGNGKSELFPLIGVTGTKGFLDEYIGTSIVEGNPGDYTNKDIENPILLSASKAKALNVKVNDIVRVKFQTIYGQMQSARLTVVAIYEPGNEFMSFVVYLDTDSLKKLMGYKNYESGALKIALKKVTDPEDVVKLADDLHKILQPGIAGYYGDVQNGNKSARATVIGVSTNSNAQKLLKADLTIIAGSIENIVDDNAALISEQLAKKINAKVGNTIKGSYIPKFEKIRASDKYVVKGIFKSEILAGDIVLANENDFFKTYYNHLPKALDTNSGAFVPPIAKTKIDEPKGKHPPRPPKRRPSRRPNSKSEEAKPATPKTVIDALSREWTLQDRTRTSDEFRRKMRELSRKKWKGASMDVNTMYEMADFIIQFEGALRMIAFVMVMILFFIILIGVVNTLRMSIRERTREIGTIRAVGMQKRDVRQTFIFENLFLSFFAAISGTIVALILMWILSLLNIEAKGMLSLIIVDNHLHFLPKIGSLIFYILLIMGVTALTAYFPARKAAELSAADALRHYE